ncbi:MAG: DUF3592 domain-containing protein [Deltaproteobacteria bacterium]|nr:DUF3592 domain-containing protein [Deltaproteobacteria bacterium]
MIKQPWLLVVSGILLVGAIGFAVDRLIFLASAEKTQGTVERITASNGRCGSKKNKYPCTRFEAEVAFTTKKGRDGEITVSAGSARGNNQPTSAADLSVGRGVPVVYNPRNPSKAYQDSLWGVWGTPLMMFIGQVATLFGSLSEGRRRQRW